MALSVGTGVDVLVGADAVVVIGVAEEWFPNGDRQADKSTVSAIGYGSNRVVNKRNEFVYDIVSIPANRK